MTRLLLFQGRSEYSGEEYEYVVIDTQGLDDDGILEEYDEMPVATISLDDHDFSAWPTDRGLRTS